MVVKHADNYSKMALVYLHSPDGCTFASNIVKVVLHELQTCIFHQLRLSCSVTVVIIVTTDDAM